MQVNIYNRPMDPSWVWLHYITLTKPQSHLYNSTKWLVGLSVIRHVFRHVFQVSTKIRYPSSHNHGSMENGCISNMIVSKII